MGKQNIKILIVDDHQIIRQVTRKRLEEEDDFEVIAEATNGVKAVRFSNKHSPDVILMDNNMPKWMALRLQKKLLIIVVS